MRQRAADPTSSLLYAAWQLSSTGRCHRALVACLRSAVTLNNRWSDRVEIPTHAIFVCSYFLWGTERFASSGAGILPYRPTGRRRCRQGCCPPAQQRFHQSFRDRRAERRHHRSYKEERRQRRSDVDDLFFQGPADENSTRRPRNSNRSKAKAQGSSSGRTATSLRTTTWSKARTDRREAQGRSRIPGEIVGTDEKTDVAVIKIDADICRLRSLPIAMPCGWDSCLCHRRAFQARLHFHLRRGQRERPKQIDRDGRLFDFRLLADRRVN